MLKLILSLLLLPSFVAAQAGEEKDLSFTGLSYPITVEVKAGKETGEICYESPYSAAPEEDYDIVLLHGVMPNADMRLDIVAKPRTIFGAATRYEQTGFRRYPNGRFWAKFKAPALSLRPVKFTVTDMGLKSTSEMVIYATELLTQGDLKEGVAEPAEPAAPAEPAEPAAYVPAPELSVPANVPFKLVRRAGWRAKAPKQPYSTHAPYYFTLHHTQAHYPANFDAAVLEMQFIQDYHQNAKNWNDIGYHFLIDPQGTIFEGRPISVVGAHVLNRNTGNVGISIMGNYHPPAKDVFTARTQDSFVSVGRYVRNAYAVTPANFFAHRDIGASDCPGDNLYAKKNLLRDLVFNAEPRPVATDPSFEPTPAQAESLRELYRRLNGR